MALTDISHPTDIAMLTDLYELTMAQGLWESGKANEQGCFTAFYRDHPFGSAYAVMCGTAELPELVENLRFTPEDIDYLASLQAPAGGAMFKPGFLDYLRDFRAHVNIDAVPEGELSGEAMPTTIAFKDNSSGEIHTESFEPGSFGIFVFTGTQPHTELVEHLVDLAPDGGILTDESMATRTPGLFAAGDIRSKRLRQVVTAVSDGAIAATSAYAFLR